MLPTIRHLSYLFPDKNELSDLSQQTGLSESQVNLWFRNARTRSGWSKLYGNKLYAAKDRQKLQAYFEEYEVLRRLHGRHLGLGTTLATNDVHAMVQKVLKWFRVKKPQQCNQSSSPCGDVPVVEVPESGSVSPWVKDILFSTLESLRQSASSSKRLVPSLPSLGPPVFGKPVADMIDPSLRSSSPECSSDESVPGSSQSVCGSSRSESTWSSVSTSSSRTSSPPLPSTSLPGSQWDLCHPPVTPSTAVPPPLPAYNCSASPDPPMDPQLDISTPLLSYLSSDAYSPLSPTHEPCAVATGQFDDADEE